MANFYYISPNVAYNFSLENIEKSSKTKEDLVGIIRRTVNFCRESVSIETSTLIQFINQPANITIYSMEPVTERLTGVINFSIKTERDNTKYIHINALCVPEINKSSGLGKELIMQIIRFSKKNNYNKIKLICYGNVFKFYEMLGFTIKNIKSGHDSDGDSDSDADPEYYMYLDIEPDVDATITTTYTSTSAHGGKSKKSKTYKKSKKSKTHKKSKKSKTHEKSKKI
jgi:hypothetical protein